MEGALLAREQGISPILVFSDGLGYLHYIDDALDGQSIGFLCFPLKSHNFCFFFCFAG